MTYSPPALLITQELVSVPAANSLPLHACILAPRYGLHRYGVVGEEALLGAYTPASGNTFTTWPDNEGGTVDVLTSVLKVKDAIIQYFTGTVGSAAATDGLLADGGNRIRFPSLIFKTLNGYSRSASFGTRDVKLGDIIKVVFGSTTIESVVSGLVADVDDAAVATPAVPDSGNAAAAILTQTADVTDLTDDTGVTGTVSAAAFKGLSYGYPTEQYILTVTTPGEISTSESSESSSSESSSSESSSSESSSSESSQSHSESSQSHSESSSSESTSSESTSSSSSSQSSSSSSSSESSSSSSEEDDYGSLEDTVFSVVAVNGDDDGTFVAGASGVAVALGAQGVTLALTYDGSEEVKVGDTIVVDVAIAYTVPSLEAAGTYIGLADTTYIVEVVNGGLVGTDVDITVKATTLNGSDAMPATLVTADAYNVIGTQGLTVNFVTGDQLVTGDRYLVAASAAGAGAVRTLVLRDKVVGAVTTDVLTVTLSLLDTITVADAYWTASAASIVAAAAMKHSGTYLGVAQLHNVLGGDLYIDYRELLTTGANILSSLDSLLDVEDTVGPAVKENPLSLMLKAALTPADGTAVYYVQLASDDLAGYTAAAEIQDFRLEPYSLVPYSTVQNVCDMLETSADEASSETRALYRQLIRGVDIAVTSAFYTEDSADGDLLATLIDTALTSANAEFVAEGIRAGDTIHINYQPDNTGGTTYDTYTVATVVSDTELTVTVAPSVDLTIAIKMEVWRTATAAEYSAQIAAIGVLHDNRRVCALWSDKLAFGGEADVSKSILAAYIAGLRSAVAPHQPLSNYELSNLDITITIPLGSTSLNTIAAGGIWIVYEDTSGATYSRHQLTTDMEDVSHREQSVTTNGDAIVRDFRDNVQDLYGKGNVSDEMLELIRSRLYSVKSIITARPFPPQIGPQLQDMTIEKLYKDPVNKDHIWCEVDLDLPEPLNQLHIKFRIF